MMESGENRAKLSIGTTEAPRSLIYRADAVRILIDYLDRPSVDLSALAQFTRLKILEISGTSLETIDLSPLAWCPTLVEVHLVRNRLSSIDLAPLASLPKLKKLSLAENRLKRIDLSALRNCSRFTALELMQNELESIDLSPMAKCTNLEHLSLHHNRLAALDISPLRHCRMLRTFRLSKNNLETLDLQPLESSGSLIELDLIWNRLKGIDLSSLAECRSLRHLLLAHNRLTHLNLTALRHAAQLEDLDLHDNKIQMINLSTLGQCEALWSINLESNRLTKVDLSPLTSCMRLKSLNLGGNRLQYLDISPLFDLFRLRYLEAGVPLVASDELATKKPRSPAIRLFCSKRLVTYISMEASDLGQVRYGKVLLIGESRAGKSWLAFRLRNPTSIPPSTGPTHGLDVHSMTLSGWKVYLWDFGGEEDYTNVHRLFFSERGLYLFVIDPTRLLSLGDWLRSAGRWFTLFDQCARPSGYLVLIASNASSIAGNEPVENFCRDIGDWISRRTSGEYRLHGSLIRVDSETGQGITELVSQLPQFLAMTGAEPTSYAKKWGIIREVIGQISHEYENSLAIVKGSELLRKLSQRGLTNLGEAGIGMLLNVLHEEGLLLYLDAVNLRRKEEQGYDTKAHGRTTSGLSPVLFNVSAASKAVAELHRYARDSGSGIIIDEQIDSLERDGFEFTVQGASGTTTIRVPGVEVKSLLGFLHQARLLAYCSGMYLFPYALSLNLKEDEWQSMDCALAVCLRLKFTLSISGFVEWATQQLDLLPVSVWSEGVLFRTKGKNEVLCKIIFADILEDSRNRLTQATVMVRTHGGLVGLGGPGNHVTSLFDRIVSWTEDCKEDIQVIQEFPRVCCPKCASDRIDERPSTSVCPDCGFIIDSTTMGLSRSLADSLKARTVHPSVGRQLSHLEEMIETVASQTPQVEARIIERMDQRFDALDRTLSEINQTLQSSGAPISEAEIDILEAIHGERRELVESFRVMIEILQKQLVESQKVVGRNQSEIRDKMSTILDWLQAIDRQLKPEEKTRTERAKFLVTDIIKKGIQKVPVDWVAFCVRKALSILLYIVTGNQDLLQSDS